MSSIRAFSQSRPFLLVAFASCLLGPPSARAQEPTVDEQIHTLDYLKKRACVEPDGADWIYTENPFRFCLHDEDCPGFGSGELCRLRAWVEPDDSLLYPAITHPPDPINGGSGEARTRYVPLCEDGSGDHEWSLSGGAEGIAPNCLPSDYIRCASGVRPRYRADRAVTPSRDWLIHAGAGGHASSPNTSNHTDLSMVTPGRTIWALSHSQDAGAYTLGETTNNRFQFSGIFDSSAANPFSSFNRVWIEKCTPDRWLGNRMHLVSDFSSDLVVETVVGACFDTDGSGTGNCGDQTFCDDSWDPIAMTPLACAAVGYPGTPACDCADENLAPPNEGAVPEDRSYNVYYHGKRIVRAVWADIDAGITTYAPYPLETVSGIHEQFPTPDGTSRVAFHCHSNGCIGLQVGHIDELRSRIRADHPGAEVYALFNGSFRPGTESEITVSNYDGIDVSPEDDIPDNDGIIDDARSLYDHDVDTVASTLQPMARQVFEPGFLEVQLLADWWDPTQAGYDVPIDASCLAHHCPGTLDWETDLLCAPCNESVHVMLNHLQTPFMYNQSQTDSVLSNGAVYCVDGSSVHDTCDYEGRDTESINGGVDVIGSHFRKLVRKGVADLARDGQLLRCEGGVGNEAPYDRIVVVSPDWSHHGPLSENEVAQRMLDGKSLVQHAWDFVFGSVAMPYLCLEDDGTENSLDFSDVPSCGLQARAVPSLSPGGLFLVAAFLVVAHLRCTGRS